MTRIDICSILDQKFANSDYSDYSLNKHYFHSLNRITNDYTRRQIKNKDREIFGDFSINIEPISLQ